MTAVQHFNFQNTDIRTLQEGDRALFVAADVATVLGYQMASGMTRHLDYDEKGMRLTRTPGGEQNVAVLTEPGLYRAILQRETGRMTDDFMRAQVKAFKRWITHEVIPAIRKTGGYQLASPEEQMAKGLIAAQQMLDEKTRQLEEAKPKAEFAETFLSANGDYDTRDAAQILRRDHGITNIGQNRLRDWMQRHSWIDAKRRPYQHKIDTGHLRLKPSSFRFKRTNGEEQLADPQLRVTPKGVEALARAMRAGQTMEAA